MSSERNELADVFTGHTVGFGGFPKKLMRGHAQEIAALVLAAGYRKPRTITTIEELGNLPFGSVVLDGSKSTATKLDGDYWLVTGFVSHFRVEAIDLPATVLHEGASA